MRHTSKEGKGFDQPVQNGLGALGWQGQGEGAVGVGPGNEQDRDELAALGEIDVDVAEVGFEALAGIVVQRDEGLGRARLLAADIEANPFGTAAIAVLVAEATEDLGSGVALFGRRVFIGMEDVVDEELERIDNRGQRLLPCVGLGLGLAEDLADFAAGVMELAGQFADTQLVDGMGSADTCVFVHLDHPSSPCSWTPKGCTSLQEMCWGWARFRRGFWPGGWARIGRGFPLRASPASCNAARQAGPT
jgi:hypothetical protein